MQKIKTIYNIKKQAQKKYEREKFNFLDNEKDFSLNISCTKLSRQTINRLGAQNVLNENKKILNYCKLQNTLYDEKEINYGSNLIKFIDKIYFNNFISLAKFIDKEQEYLQFKQTYDHHKTYLSKYINSTDDIIKFYKQYKLYKLTNNELESLIKVLDEYKNTLNKENVVLREIPIKEIGTKWWEETNCKVNNKRLCELLLGQKINIRKKPQWFHVKYLDSIQRKTLYDSLITNDKREFSYYVNFGIIIENEETFLSFPDKEKGIAIFGSGKWGCGIDCIPSLPEIKKIKYLYYWGDLDIDGFNILAAYRKNGLNIKSIFMDKHTLSLYYQWGTNESNSKDIGKRAIENKEFLTAEELAVCDILNSQALLHRRLEQERIPIEYVKKSINSLL